MLAGHISVEEFKPVNNIDFMRYLSSCKKKIFAGVFDEQSNKSADGIMELFTRLFDKDMNTTLVHSLYAMAYDIQDWFFENGLVSDRQIYDIRYQDSMWSGQHFEQAKFMLFRRGIISFDNVTWHRRIRIEYLSGSEREYYFPVLANSKYDPKKVFDGCFQTTYGSTYSNSDAYHNFERYQSLPGFVDCIPDEFLIGSDNKYFNKEKVKRTDVFSTLYFDGRIQDMYVDTLADRYIRALTEHFKKEAEARDEAIKKSLSEYDTIVSMFSEHGIVVQRPKYEEWNRSDRYVFACTVGKYEHTMYVMKTSPSFSEQVKDEAADYKEMLMKYADTVHAEYDRLVGEGINVTHVMEGGGAQMQAFFCSPDGYVSIMYLGMKGEPPVKRWTCHMQGAHPKSPKRKNSDPFGKRTFYSGKVVDTDLTRK